MKKQIHNWIKPVFDKQGMTKWHWICQHQKNLVLRKYSDIGAFTYINAKYGVTIEEHVQIGSHCSIYSLSTIDDKKGRVLIKSYARLGSHSVVMPGVTIGRYSLIGAHSFVNKDIPDGVLAFGIPIRVIRKLTKEEIDLLLK